jgi:polyhydroxyalkanoate synthesis regulator phasin
MGALVIDSATMAEKKPTRGDAVRSAVDEAFQAAAGQAQVTRERAQDIVEELSGAAGRLRDVLEDLRPPSTDDVRDLREEVRALAERVARLEAAQTEKPKRAPRARTGASPKRAPKTS